jgi:hypothetical protein
MPEPYGPLGVVRQLRKQRSSLVTVDIFVASKLTVLRSRNSSNYEARY